MLLNIFIRAHILDVMSAGIWMHRTLKWNRAGNQIKAGIYMKICDLEKGKCQIEYIKTKSGELEL